MGNRSRPFRSKTPLLVAASAISRACDPKQPSRITVLRLLGDALHVFEESQLVVDEIKARAATYTSRDGGSPAPRGQLDADARVRSSHEQGARALFSAVSSALIKLPTRAGPLRRRAVDLLHASGKAAGPAVVMQAADSLRSHISGLKRLTWSDTERGDFEVVCAIMTLADISNCAIAGREVAKDSVVFLLGPRVRQKCRRGDLAYAIAHVVQCFPFHAPPDDRLVDNLLELALSASALKQGSAGVGSALLTAVVVPHLVSRGPQPADDVTASCGRALRTASTSTERAMWAVAMARASVTARRSTTYQLRKYGNSEAGTKFPNPSNSFNRLSQRFEKDPEEMNPSAWVSNETFEEALLQVAKAAGLEEGRVDASVAVASVLRMWSVALPESVPVIVPRTFARLLPDLSSVSAVSALVDGIWLGLLKELKPSLSTAVLENLLPALSEKSDLRTSAALHVCSTLLFKHGRQCICESGLTLEYGHVSTTLIKRAHEALDVSSQFVRMGGVRLMAGLISALPRTCSQFLTAVLQNLRIADLTLATKHPSSGEPGTFASLKSIEQELSSILGNSVALSVLMSKISSGQCCVPVALVRQCTIDIMALLRPHQASQKPNMHGIIASCIRRRAGWGLIAALARSKQQSVFEGESLNELLSLWKEELGFAGGRGNRQGVQKANSLHTPGIMGLDGVGDQSATPIDEVQASSSTRSAALHALSCALQNAGSFELEQCARALVGACAARIVATQTVYGISAAFGNFAAGGGAPGLGTDGPSATESSEKRRSLLKVARVLTTECAQLVQCVSIVPPRGDAAELCYYVAICLGEEAQRVLGESDAAGVADPTPAQMSTASSERSFLFETAMSNHRPSLSRLVPGLVHLDSLHGTKIVQEGNMRTSSENKAGCGEADKSWVFSMQGIEALIAEDVLVFSAVGIAAIVSEDLMASGSLVESLSSAKPSPSFSAIIALEMSKRLSRSDLAEINRALAALQVLAKRSLGVTGGARRGAISESKSGKLYAPHVRGDGNNFGAHDIPGAALQRLTKSESWLKWARTFSNEGRVAKVPFHDFHTRALGTMYSTRSIAAEAHRELGSTGGPTLWTGLMRRVISVVKHNMGSVGILQSILLANGIAALGALLEVVPEPRNGLMANGTSNQNCTQDFSIDLDDISDEGICVIADAIEKGNADTQAAAALALSNCSHRVAVYSERLLGALLKAWAQEKGDFSSMGQLGRCANETDVWMWCFSHIWRDMGVRLMDNSVRFFSQDSSGIGCNSVSFAAGAAAVLSSCRLHWWALTESEYFAVTEMSTELLQWAGGSSQKARAAGLYGMTALWAARIDAARIRRISRVDGVVSGTSFGIKSNSCSDISPVLRVEAFSLKEPTRNNSAVGPFLDEILYEALAPYEIAANSDELQTAATAAIIEMIRGVGVEETCSTLPRLPESLLASVDNGSAEARRLLDILVRSDARSRPRYWFGLCRAVCLKGDRLNYGPSKAVWDVAYQTRAFSVRVAVEAVDSSLGACQCEMGENSRPATDLPKHSCAYGFLRKITDFATELCKKDGIDFAACSEGCNLVQRLAFRIGSVGSSWKPTDPTLRDYRDVWDSCLSTMEGLLVDSVPQMVVSTAGTAVSELLVSFLRLWKVEYFGSAHGKVASFLDKSVGQDLQRRFVYSDQGEEVGINATLALVARYAKVVTALRATSCVQGSTVTEDLMTLQPAKNLFLAIIGDFVSTLSGSGLQLLAKSGGAITSGMVSESQLHAAMVLHIAPIVLGAVSCMGSSTNVNVNITEQSWANRCAAGVRMAEGGHNVENVAMGCYVWLLKHRHESTLSSSTRLSFCFQSHEALTSVCCTDRKARETVREVLASFAQWNVPEYLKFVSRISTCEQVASTTKVVLAELTLAALRGIVDDGLVSNFEDRAEVHTVNDGIGGLTRMLNSLLQCESNAVQWIAAQVLDTVFHIVRDDYRRVIFLYDDVAFQRAICECMASCIKAMQDSSRTAHHCLSKVMAVFRYAYREESLPHLKMGMAMGVTLHRILGEEKTEDELIRLLLTPTVKEKEEGLSELTLGWTLRCYGTERFIINVIHRGSKMKSGSSGNARALVYQLGLLGLSTRHFCIPAGLRIAIAAIRVDAASGDAINRVGLILYSICLSKLVRSLPTKPGNARESRGDLPEGASFLLELAQKDSATLGSIVSLLRDDERKSVKLFLLASEVEGKQTNAYQTTNN